MKKLIVLFGLVLGVSAVFAQSRVKGNGIMKEITRDISRYNAVKVKGSFDVVLTDEIQGKIRIVGEENVIPLVESKVSFRELELGLQRGLSLSYKKLVIYVPAKDVNKITLTGSGDIENKGNFSGRELNIILDGSGDIDLKHLRFDKVNISLKGSGDVNLEGRTKEFVAQLNGSGDISANALYAEKVYANINGSGDIDTYSSKEFTGKINGSGNIKVKGNPKEILQSKKGSGTIKVL